MEYRIGERQFEAGSRYLTLELRASHDLLDDPAALRRRLAEDGYLLLRGVHDPAEVVAAREDILRRMAEEGLLDPARPVMDGVASPAARETPTTSVRSRERLKTPALRTVVYGDRIMRVFARLLDAPVASYQFQWLRAAGPGAGTGIHCDAPYMGRGTLDVYTCWTPLGDMTPEMGPLVLCLGSHRWGRVRETYGRCDVDRDLIEGIFSRDPAELVDRLGGRWATAPAFGPGDVVIFGLYMLHASLVNTTGRYRLSCDTRYQRASDPMDDRWAGVAPRGHSAFWQPGASLEPVEVSRRRWGI